MYVTSRWFLLLLMALIAGCGPGTGTSGRSAAVLPDSATLVPIDAAGLRAHVADGRAELTMVNVWATWCGPCREEFPALVAAAARHRDQGVRLMLVSADFDEALPAARRFLESHGVRDTSFVKAEADMAFIDGVHAAWSGALPATLIYDRQGQLVEYWEGLADSARFENAITRALQNRRIPS
jgi:thiol-disulfide isomerase/thioredoxin